MKYKNTLKGGLFAFFMAVAIVSATAEHQEGAVTRVSRSGSYLVRLRVYVDTTGNRMADTVLQFFDPEKDYVASNLEAFIERGMRVTFDDNDYFIEDNMKFVAGNNTKTIDGDNMLVFFPNERGQFKYAAAEYDAQQRQNSMPQSRGSEHRSGDRPVVAYTPALQARFDKARRELELAGLTRET